MSAADLPCRRIVELVTDYLEGVLDAESRRRFEEHLAGCGGCRRYVEQIDLTRQALGEVRDEDLSPEAWAALRGTFGSLFGT